MGAVLSFVARFGPLIAAFLVGLGGTVGQFFPGAAPIIGGLTSVLALFGVQNDAEVAQFLSDTAVAVLLLFGSVRKGVALIKAKYFV